MGTINRYLASNIKFMCPRTQKVQLFTSFRSHMDPHFGTIWLLLGTKWLSRYVFAMSRCVIEFIWGGSINHLITSDIKFTRSRVKRYNYKSIFEVARIVIYGVLSIQSGQNGAPLVLHWTALMSSCSASIKGYLAGPDINYLFIWPQNQGPLRLPAGCCSQEKVGLLLIRTISHYDSAECRVGFI